MSEGLELAREYHRNLPPHLREHLQQARGISPEIIDLHVLGWNGSRVTIRICDRAGQAGLGAEGPDRRSENTGHARSPRRAMGGSAFWRIPSTLSSTRASSTAGARKSWLRGANLDGRRADASA